jgi:hypothetical protein
MMAICVSSRCIERKYLDWRHAGSVILHVERQYAGILHRIRSATYLIRHVILGPRPSMTVANMDAITAHV